MVSKEALAEIRAIVEDIKAGRKQHNQENYHSDCGTSHCIAGWKQVIDLMSAGVQPYYTWHLHDNVWKLNNSPYSGSVWSYAEKQWGLNWEQANSLFRSDLTLLEIDSNLKELEEKYDCI